MKNGVMMVTVFSILIASYALHVQGVINKAFYRRLPLAKSLSIYHCQATGCLATAERNNAENGGRSGKYKHRKGMGKMVIQDIQEILQDTKRRDDRKVAASLAKFLQESDAMLNRAHALSMMRLASKYHFDVTTSIPLTKVMDLFALERLQTTSHVEDNPIWEAYMLSQLLYGLRMFNDKTEGITSYLQYLASAVEETEAAGRKMNNQEVANSLYGLAGLELTPAVGRIIEGVMRLAPDSIKTSTNTFGSDAEDLDDSTLEGIIASPMTGQEISMALYGLRTMSISYRSSRNSVLPRVLTFLSKKIAESPASIPLAPRACANALNGLRGLNPAKMRECRLVLEVLTPRIISSMKSGQPFDPVAVGSALSGMKVFDGSVPEVLQLIDTLADLVERSGELYSQNTITSCVIGLSNLSDEDKAVRKLLVALATKINQHPHCRGSAVRWSSSSTPAGGGGGAGGDGAIFEDGMDFLKGSKAESEKESESESEDTCDKEGEEAQFTAGSIAACLMSLRHMNGRHWQTRSLLDALQKKIMIHATQPFTSADVGRCLYGMQSMSATAAMRGRHSSAIRDTLGKLSARVQVLGCELKPRDVGSALYGLKSNRVRVHFNPAFKAAEDNNSTNSDTVSEGENEVHSRVLTYGGDEPGILQEEVSTAAATTTSTGDATAAVGAGAPSDVEVRSLLHVLALRIAEHSDTSIGAQSFGMAMLGLRSMNSDVREVQQVLHALTPRLQCSKLDRQACANSLYSMGQMSSGRKDVRSFLSALTPQIAKCVALAKTDTSLQFSSQEVSNAFLGMQRMDSKHVETIAVLMVMVKALKRFVASTDSVTGEPMTMTSQGLGNMLTGLQTMENENNHLVDEVLECAAELINRCTEPMLPHDIASALFGLQGVNVLTQEVRALLISLIDKMARSSLQWSPKEIGYALVGLSGLQQTASSSDEVVRVIEQINVKLSQSELQGQPGVTFRLYGGKGFKILDAFGNVICKG